MRPSRGAGMQGQTLVAMRRPTYCWLTERSRARPVTWTTQLPRRVEYHYVFECKRQTSRRRRLRFESFQCGNAIHRPCMIVQSLIGGCHRKASRRVTPAPRRLDAIAEGSEPVHPPDKPCRLNRAMPRCLGAFLQCLMRRPRSCVELCRGTCCKYTGTVSLCAA